MTEHSALRRAMTAAEVMDAAQARLRELRSWRDVRYAYRDLDAELGPLIPGQLTTVTAERGAGRSMFAHDLCRAVAIAQRRSVLLVTGRLTIEQVGIRLLAAEARVSRAHLRTGDRHQADDTRLAEAEHVIRSAPIVLTTASDTADALASDIHRVWLAHDVDLVVIDDADDLDAREHPQRNSLVVLSEMARKLDVPVVVTGGLRRARPSPEPPREQELWGPPSVDGVAVSIAIHLPDLFHGDSSRPAEADLVIRRLDADPVMVSVVYQGQYGRFDNMELAQ